jgi:hypothetical protein
MGGSLLSGQAEMDKIDANSPECRKQQELNKINESALDEGNLLILPRPQDMPGHAEIHLRRPDHLFRSPSSPRFAASVRHQEDIRPIMRRS